MFSPIAASFYGINAVLIPSAQSENVALSLIAMSQADFLIAEAGSIPADNLKFNHRSIRELVVLR